MDPPSKTAHPPGWLQAPLQHSSRPPGWLQRKADHLVREYNNEINNFSAALKTVRQSRHKISFSILLVHSFKPRLYPPQGIWEASSYELAVKIESTE